MKKKKIFALLLSGLLLAGALLGCSGGGGSAVESQSPPSGADSPSSGASEAAPSGGEATLTIWGDPDNQAVLEDCFDEINAAFTAKYPNIKLDYQYSGSFDGLNVALQSDSLPDVFWVQGNKSTKMAEMAQGGYLLPLDQFNPDQSRFPEAAIEYSQVDGVTYCTYPCFIDYALVYYNVEMFEKYGIEKPANFDDFIAAMETLKSNGETPIAFGGGDEWARYWPVQVMGGALANGDLNKIKGGDKTGDYPEIVALFDYYREFTEKGYFGANAASISGDSAQLAFSNGKAAMTFDGTWSNNLFKEMPFKVGAFAFPGKDGTRFAQSGFSNFNTYAVSSKTKYPEAAFTYVNFLGELEAQQIMATHLASIPIISDIQVSDPMVAEFSDFQDVGNNIYHVFSGVECGGRPQDIFHSSVLADLMTSKITGQEGMDLIKAEMNK